MIGFYPKKINPRFQTPGFAGVPFEANAEGRWANFLCGVAVRFSLRIDADTKTVAEAKFKTNGCGYVVATADFLCEKITGQNLTDLHGLEDLESSVKKEFGSFPENRRHCPDICFDALQNALAVYRQAQIEEWTGEKALICTCFGVSEERIEQEIEEKKLSTVEEVGDACHAGTGCGSCQPLIQEILDWQHDVG
jgi:NifU-like protein